MSIVIPYDTETTNFGNTSLPLNDPSQPHLVQISALRFDTDSSRVGQSMSLIVRPEGWDIPEPAARVHGITTEVAAANGLPEKTVLDIFLHVWDGNLRVAHNSAFDKHIIACAIARYHGQGRLLEAWLAGPCFCTMLSSKELVDARTSNGRRKNPNLGEAYEFFTGKPLDHAHSANADCVATLHIYQALMARSDQ